MNQAAVVINTYNHPRFLGICLEALALQSRKDFDVFIADDGSKDETKQKIEAYKPRFETGIRHYWHPDTGKFERAKICNNVFRDLKPYRFIICVDHDTIAHRDFVKDHYFMHEGFGGPGERELLFMGRRVDLGPEVTETITEQNVRDFSNGLNWGFNFRLIKSGLAGETPAFMRAVRITAPWLQKMLKKDRVPDILGSNYSVSTRLMHRVNGYDESFDRYWGEDGDLYIRIRNTAAKNPNVKVRGLKSMALQFHMFHPRREFTPDQVAKYEEDLRRTDYTWCENGIVKSGVPINPDGGLGRPSTSQAM